MHRLTRQRWLRARWRQSDRQRPPRTVEKIPARVVASAISARRRFGARRDERRRRRGIGGDAAGPRLRVGPPSSTTGARLHVADANVQSPRSSATLADVGARGTARAPRRSSRQAWRCHPGPASASTSFRGHSQAAASCAELPTRSNERMLVPLWRPGRAAFRVMDFAGGARGWRDGRRRRPRLYAHGATTRAGTALMEPLGLSSWDPQRKRPTIHTIHDWRRPPRRSLSTRATSCATLFR